jgi:hypothetical protein
MKGLGVGEKITPKRELSGLGQAVDVLPPHSASHSTEGQDIYAIYHNFNLVELMDCPK